MGVRQDDNWQITILLPLWKCLLFYELDSHSTTQNCGELQSYGRHLIYLLNEYIQPAISHTDDSRWLTLKKKPQYKKIIKPIAPHGNTLKPHTQTSWLSPSPFEVLRHADKTHNLKKNLLGAIHISRRIMFQAPWEGPFLWYCQICFPNKWDPQHIFLFW